MIPRNNPCPCGSGKRFKHCCGVLEKITPLPANNVHDIMRAALFQQQANQFEAAENLYRQALTLFPDEPDCLHMLGVIYLQSGRYPEAAELILQALKLTNWKFGAMRQNLALVLDRLWDDAILWDDERRQNLERLFIEQSTMARSDVPGLPMSSDARAKTAPGKASFPPRAQVLVVDFSVPRPDRDSASVRMESILRLWRRLGCSIAFLPLNMDHSGSNASWLEQEGIEMLNWPAALGMGQVLASRGQEFDVIFISRYKMALPYITLLRHLAPQALFVFDTVDLHYLREQREAETSGDPEALRQAAMTRSHELGVIRDADITLVVSGIEQSLLSRETPQARVLILSNIHDIRGRQAGFSERRDIFFVGGFDHKPNVDAVKWYVAEVWPHVRRQLPEARTYLVGSNMPDAVGTLAGNGIVAVGYAQDLSPYLDGCRVSVAPLRFGAGVKGKINTAHGSGVPVVATTLAAEGMHLEDGRDVLLADSGRDFAAAIVRLYGDEELWNTLSEGGLENVARHFSAHAAESLLEQLLQMALAKKEAYLAAQSNQGTSLPEPQTGGTRQDCLILLPAGYGSLGDEAMVRGLLAQLDGPLAGWNIDLLSIYDDERWPRFPGVRNVITLSPGAEGTTSGVLEKMKAIMPRYEAFALIGADVLDGHYSVQESCQRLALVNMANRLGLTSTIFGFSFNGHPHPDALADLINLAERVLLQVRDPVSLRRLASHGIRNAAQVADIAFLMPPAGPSFNTEEIEAWIRAQKTVGRTVMIFNLSRQALAGAGQTRERVLDELSEMLAMLISTRRLSVLWLPHDLRKGGKAEDNDVAIAMALARRVSKKLAGDEYHRLFVAIDVSEVKRLAGMADLVITGRMHLAVAALGMGVPTIGISFQGKFEGLWEHFDLMGRNIDARTFDCRKLEEISVELLSRLNEERKNIEVHLPKVIKLAQKNFASWPFNKGSSPL